MYRLTNEKYKFFRISSIKNDLRLYKIPTDLESLLHISFMYILKDKFTSKVIQFELWFLFLSGYGAVVFSLSRKYYLITSVSIYFILFILMNPKQFSQRLY